MTSTVDRIAGMILGHATGDALGAIYEFPRGKRSLPVESKTERGGGPPLESYTGRIEHPPQYQSRFQGLRRGVLGQVTDDTEMSLALLRSLLRQNGYYLFPVLSAYQAWAHSRPFGMGRNTRELLGSRGTVEGYAKIYTRKFGFPPPLDGMTPIIPQENPQVTQSNGSLMRAYPLALLNPIGGYPTHLSTPFPGEQVSPSFAHPAVYLDAALTNPNQINLDSSAFYVTLLHRLLRGGDLTQALTQAQGVVHHPLVIQTLQRGFAGQLPDRDPKKKGWVLTALGYLAYVLGQITQRKASYQEVIDWLIRQGGDTDTNAAIVGAVLGAYYGLQDLQQDPKTRENIQRVLNSRPEEGNFPRPEEYLLRDFNQLVPWVTQFFG